MYSHPEIRMHGNFGFYTFISLSVAQTYLVHSDLGGRIHTGYPFDSQFGEFKTVVRQGLGNGPRRQITQLWHPIHHSPVPPDGV